MGSILYHWNLLQQSPEAYDDFKITWRQFVEWMWYLPTYEIGDPPVGLFTFVPAMGGNAWIQGVMYDWRYDERESVFTALASDIFDRGIAHRVTSTVNADRPMARNVMIKMQGTLEGIIRQGGQRGQNIEIWAKYREDIWQQPQP